MKTCKSNSKADDIIATLNDNVAKIKLFSENLITGKVEIREPEHQSSCGSYQTSDAALAGPL